MKLGMPILYELSSIEENIKLASELKLDFLELNLNFAYCRQALNEPKKLEEQLCQANLLATVHFFDEACFATYEEVRKAYLELFIKYFNLIRNVKHIKQIVVHLNPGPVVTINGIKHYIYEKEYDGFIKNLLESLTYLRSLCLESNINLVIENVSLPLFLKKTILTLAKENFDFCFDVGHDYLSRELLLEICKQHDLNIKEFHLHNSDGFKDHLPLQKGLININYFKRMALIHDSYVVIEVKSKEDLIESVHLFQSI